MRIFHLLACIGVWALAFPLSLKAQSQAQNAGPVINDGPYIFFENGHVIARWLAEGGLQEDTITGVRPLKIGKEASASFDASYLNLNDPFELSPITDFQGVENIAAVSDIHGQFGLLLSLLKAHRIIDEAGDWSFGEGHLVVLGDIFDRGDEVTELLWFIHKLEKQAERANGKVHYLLGNHEIMVMQGDLRYVNKKYRYTMAGMKRPYGQLFGEDTYLGRWLRSKPIAISINNTVFVHAGFSGELLQQNLTFGELNAIFQEKIIGHPEDSILAAPLLHLLYSEKGPVWYRGYFDEGFTQKQAQAILRTLKKKHIVVGHTSFSEILPLFRNRIIGIDSSIKLGKNGEMLLIHKKKFYRGTLNGEMTRLK